MPERRDVYSAAKKKGYFAFGGSTVIVLAQKGSAVPEKRIWNYSRLGIENAGTAGRNGWNGRKNRVKKKKWIVRK